MGTGGASGEGARGVGSGCARSESAGSPHGMNSAFGAGQRGEPVRGRMSVCGSRGQQPYTRWVVRSGRRSLAVGGGGGVVRRTLVRDDLRRTEGEGASPEKRDALGIALMERGDVSKVVFKEDKSGRVCEGSNNYHLLLGGVKWAWCTRGGRGVGPEVRIHLNLLESGMVWGQVNFLKQSSCLSRCRMLLESSCPLFGPGLVVGERAWFPFLNLVQSVQFSVFSLPGCMWAACVIFDEPQSWRLVGRGAPGKSRVGAWAQSGMSRAVVEVDEENAGTPVGDHSWRDRVLGSGAFDWRSNRCFALAGGRGTLADSQDQSPGLDSAMTGEEQDLPSHCSKIRTSKRLANAGISSSLARAMNRKAALLEGGAGAGGGTSVAKIMRKGRLCGVELRKEEAEEFAVFLHKSA